MGSSKTGVSEMQDEPQRAGKDQKEGGQGQMVVCMQNGQRGVFKNAVLCPAGSRKLVEGHLLGKISASRKSLPSNLERKGCRFG